MHVARSDHDLTAAVNEVHNSLCVMLRRPPDDTISWHIHVSHTKKQPRSQRLALSTVRPLRVGGSFVLEPALQHHLGDGLANLAAADDGRMGIFGKYDEEVVGHHVDIGCGLVEERGEVASLIVRVGHVLAIIGVAPSHALFALKQDVHIDISAMNLQHLLLFRQTFGVDIIDEEFVAIEDNLSHGRVEQVVALDIREELG